MTEIDDAAATPPLHPNAVDAHAKRAPSGHLFIDFCTAPQLWRDVATAYRDTDNYCYRPTANRRI